MAKTKIVLNEKYSRLKDFIEQLPATFAQSGEVIYSERNILKTFECESVKINVKSFRKPIFINQIAYSIFRKSKAERSYLYASILKERGFDTPDPIAYIEIKQYNLLKYSLYISTHEEFDGMMRELHCGKVAGREELLKQFAQYTARLHDNQILHLDYSSGNILYKKKDDIYTFYLVDLNRMTVNKPISIDDACANFRRLWGSDEMIRFIVIEYAKARNLDEATCLSKTFEYRKKFWEAYAQKHPGAKPYFD